ncbi:hypothetical protein DH21_16835 [Serratia marcescens]|nr:hypothetical protein DH21_16835 [Serratia marcescens]
MAKFKCGRKIDTEYIVVILLLQIIQADYFYIDVFTIRQSGINRFSCTRVVSKENVNLINPRVI